jgi:hypothetical protein
LKQVWENEYNECHAYFIRIIGQVGTFVGASLGIENIYSTFYDVFWSMVLENMFVGDDPFMVSTMFVIHI